MAAGRTEHERGGSRAGASLRHLRRSVASAIRVATCTAVHGTVSGAVPMTAGVSRQVRVRCRVRIASGARDVAARVEPNL